MGVGQSWASGPSFHKPGNGGQALSNPPEPAEQLHRRLSLEADLRGLAAAPPVAPTHAHTGISKQLPRTAFRLESKHQGGLSLDLEAIGFLVRQNYGFLVMLPHAPGEE